MDAILQDLRYSVRRLTRAPGFALVAVLTLALGIGANSAIFSFINGLLLKAPGGVQDASRLVTIFTADFSSSEYSQSSWPDYEDFRQQSTVFADLAAISMTPVNVTRADQIERLAAEIVTGNYFTLLGLRPVAGRLFSASDGGDGALLVLNEDVWRQRFGADPSLIGQSLSMNGRAYLLVGIAPRQFHGLNTGTRIDAWVPIQASLHLLGSDLTQGARDSRGIGVVGRLLPGVTIERAQAQLDVLQRRLFSEYRDAWITISGQPRKLTVLSERAGRLPPDQRGTVFAAGGLLLGAVAFVLLVCCANLANLLLARAATRDLEIAIRYSLGAQRATIVRQMLTESGILALLGGIAGLLLAVWGIDLLDALRPATTAPLFIDTSIDARVLAFTLGTSVLTGILFGIAPALKSARPSLSGVLKSERTVAGTLGRLSDGLAAAQIAFALVLSVGAGLIARTLHNASRVDVGADTHNVVVASFDLATLGYDAARARQFQSDLRAQLEARPDVAATTLARRIPIAHPGGRRGVRVTGYSPKPGEEMEFPFNIVAGNYFDALRIPIVQGRAFVEQDRDGTARAVIVNEAFAQRFWPGQNPIGQEISASGNPMRIVGVARNGKYWSIREAPRPYFYLPYEQNFDRMCHRAVKVYQGRALESVPPTSGRSL